ncbi:restriction endonuclease subunit S [Enterococcus faecalis]|uniref:restriction endonuclease subunit S n=1 Tax=Enterococcus sp. C16 TaxID=3231284 RepID=UPI00192268A7|nr:restriction endonuclease subunit S [Enterococcus faecalis]EGO9280848.1 restriction endonuclease subunit S [Enterococcus faecalis]EHB5045184.1 restriction endonuclease subunit S [Enterococcus faecalis]EIM5425187.1 restriction endonuclease subunit S [Enterococcus faecalis]EIR4036324.1 restriction endonuclease subunit S [Enterococcus faecalis]
MNLLIVFTLIGVWELCKLGTLAEIVRGASPRPIQDSKWFDNTSDVGWLRISDVTEQNGRIYKLEQKLSKVGQEKTRVLRKPHLLLSIAATVGKPVVNYVNTGVHDGFLIFLNPLFDREFMFQWLEMFTPKWQKYGQPGSQLNLNSELVRNQELRMPSTNEQEKIGMLFQYLDDTITLHQRKLDQLKKLKKAYLQAMFVSTNPKNNKVPKLRFTDFEGDWELCKLGVMAPLRGGFAFKSENFQNSGVRIVRISNIDKMGKIRGPYVYCQEQENDTNYLLPNNSVLLAMSGATTGKVAILSKRSKEKYYQNQRVGYFQKNIEYSYDFIAVLVQSDLFLKQLDSVLVSGAQPNISSTEINNFNFMIPKNVEEQNQIGIFIKNIDNTITFHQNKLTQLKSLKKSYLQNMFI